MSNPQPIGNISRNFLKMNGLLNRVPTREQSQDPPAGFVHPILTPKDFKETISRYNLHIKKYNIQVWMDNAGVRDYNREVIKNRKKITVSTEQKVKEMIWKEKNKDLSPEEFNEEVERYNQKYGLQLRKRNLRQPVKPESEKFFVAFLHQLNMQLFRKKEQRARLGVHVQGEIPKVDIYPNKVVEAERDGYRTLPVSVETVRHHRERLEEAGVLLDYQFRGPNRAVKMRINPDILIVTDNGVPKNAVAENQKVTGKITKKVPHNNVSSRNTVLEENKIRDKGVVAPAPTDNICTEKSTKTPNRQGGQNSDTPVKTGGNYKKNSPGPRDSTAPSSTQSEKNELSTALAASLEDPTDLVRQLSSGKHEKYRQISTRICRQEAYYGAMHPDDFKELAIHDIFKFSSSIFADLQVYPGSWMNAFKIWKKEKFKNFNGYTLSKPNIFEQWQKMILVLKEVKKFKKNHPEWEPHYPSLYFDPTRTFKENNSFEYAYRFFRLEDEKVENLQKRKIQAKKSLRHKTDVKKAQDQIRRFLDGRISIDRVYEYVEQNCDRQVYQNLDKLIRKEFELMNTHT